MISKRKVWIALLLPWRRSPSVRNVDYPPKGDEAAAPSHRRSAIGHRRSRPMM
jgi:hypothetical protein